MTPSLEIMEYDTDEYHKNITLKYYTEKVVL